MVAPLPPDHAGCQMSDMIRRSFLAFGLLFPLLAHAQSTPQDRADLTRVETYLNSVRNLHSRFLQIAPNGATSEGQAWLSRPGRLRFQYDPPSPFLLVGGSGLLVFHDAQLKQTSNIPLDSTPLGILLQDNLHLSGDITVTKVARAPGQLQVSLVRTRTPQDGTLTLIFADQPLALRQWRVVDAQRQETRVTLYNVEMGGTFNPDLFHFIDPKFFQNQPRGG